MKHLTRLPLLACCAAALTASGAPVPKGKGAFQGPEWKRDDPGKDCQFAFDEKAGSVTFKLPARPGRQHVILRGRVTVPRLLRPAGKADFDAQVRLRAAFDPGRTPQGGGRLMGALLVVDRAEGKGAAGSGSDRFFYPNFGAYHNGQATVAWANANRLGPGAGGSSVIKLPPYRAVKVGGKELWEIYLKVERRGESLTAHVSGDGKEWSGPYGHHPFPGQPPLKFAGELRVGVAVLADIDRAAEVTFDSFRLTPVKREKAEEKAKD